MSKEAKEVEVSLDEILKAAGLSTEGADKDRIATAARAIAW